MSFQPMRRVPTRTQWRAVLDAGFGPCAVGFFFLLAAHTSSTAAAEATAAPADSIEEVVVTAQKREESAQKVPISMEVFNAQNLQLANRIDLKDLQASVPNLLIQTSPGNDQIFMRGFGSAATNYATEQDVSMYLDGIYGGRNRQFMMPFFDIERIEVLRGPQGALLGKNTAAGAVSIITAGPTRDFQAGGTATYDFDRRGVDWYSYLSGPFTDGLSGRVAVKYTDMGGWIHNLANDTREPSQRNKLIRGALRYDINDNSDVVLKYGYANTNMLGNAETPVSATDPTPSLPSDKNAGDLFGERNIDTELSHNASVTANIGLSGGFKLTGISGYSSFSDRSAVGVTNLNPEAFVFTSSERFDQYSQELRLQSPLGARFEYIFGAYYDTGSYSDAWAEQYNLLGGAAAGANHFDFSQHSDTWSVFAQSKLHITGELALQTSLRYTKNSKHGTFINTADSGFGFVLAPDNFAAASIDSSKVDPSITLQYEPAGGTMLYATYAQGSKGGGFVSNTPTVPPADFAFQPEKSENFEVGMKSAFFDHRLIADIALYDTKFNDLQVSVYDGDTLSFQTKNAAKAESKGVEASFQWAVVEGFRLAASFAYLDAKYTDFPGARCTSLDPPDCNPLTHNIKGQRLPSSSRWSGNFGADYTQSLPGGLRLTFAPSVNFRTSYIVDAGDPNPLYGAQGGFAKYDARLTLASQSDRWDVSVIGKNLGNQRTRSLVYVFPFAVPGAETYQEPARSVALQLGVKY
jgi:iron complex outermembrane recepter protein